MNKIGIITINDYNNYGNRLQNFAVQEVLNKMGYDAITVRNEQLVPVSENISIFTKIKSRGINNSLNLIGEKINKRKNSHLYQERNKNFLKFTEDNIKETEFIISNSYIPDGLHQDFSFFVTGSDQVWNPFYRNESPIDFLTFAPPEKRIAFSPSFGISELPKKNVPNYTKWIKEMKSLSVREEAGAEIIKKLTGRDAEVLIDPTLMLSREEWKSIATMPACLPNGKYILTYFLGERNKENEEWIKKVAEDNNLTIVNLLDITNKEAFISNPSDFLELINSASLVCTNSFHGAIFSIIFETPFIIFDRLINNEQRMSSRIDTLLSKFELNSRYHKNITMDKLFKLNYEKIPGIIQIEQERVYEYLNTAFSNINK